jgi:hypothetical protein
MEPPYQRPNILRLPEVTIGDYIGLEDFVDNQRLLAAGDDSRTLDPEDPAPEHIHPPDKIPRVFTGIEDWLTNTNLRCWQCGFTFDGPPKFVPTYVRESDEGGIEFGVHGNMCTFNCAELWISINYAGKEDQRWRAQENLCLVYFLFTGRRIARIRPAPNKTELRQYGGELDEESFWNKMRGLDNVAGLRDHTPCSVIPERDRTPAVPQRGRVKSALAALHGSSGRPPATDLNSVWGICGQEGGLPSPQTVCGRDNADNVAAGDITEFLDEILAADDVPVLASPVLASPPMPPVRASPPVPPMPPPAPAAEISNEDMDALLAELGI